MTVEEVGRVEIGETYRFHRLRQVKVNGSYVILDVEGDLYRVEMFGYDGKTMQELVYYRGLSGWDEGRVLSCTPYDFVIKFRAERESPVIVAEPVPEAIADPEAERPIVEGLDMEYWQRMADEAGLPILVLNQQWSVIDQCLNPCETYFVQEAEAEQWQHSDALARFEPAG